MTFTPPQPPLGAMFNAEESQRFREEYQQRLKAQLSKLKSEGWTFIHVSGREAHCGAFYWCRRQGLEYDTDFVRITIVDKGGYHYGFKDPQIATLFTLRWA